MITEKQVWAALPSSGFLRKYVEHGARWHATPAGYHMVAGLCLLAQSVPASLLFPWSTNIRSNMFGLLVGPSGEGGKSRTIEAARLTLELSGIPDAEMERPGSPEGCMDSVVGHPQIVFYSEFGQLLQSTERGQLESLRALYTDLYDCTPISRKLADRPGRKPRKPERNPRLTILGGGSPPFIESFTTRMDWEGGFMARFFTIYSTSTIIPPASFHGAEERVALASMLASYYARASDAADMFDPRPSVKVCKGWTVDADRHFTAWQEGLHQRARKFPDLARGAISRTIGNVVRTSLLLGWDIGEGQSGKEWYIGRDILECAIAMVELSLQSVVELVEGIAFDRDAQDIRDALRAIGRDLTPLNVVLRRSKLPIRRLRDALGTLQGRQVIKMVNVGDGVEYYSQMEEDGMAPVIPLRPETDLGLPQRQAAQLGDSHREE